MQLLTRSSYLPADGASHARLPKGMIVIITQDKVPAYLILLQMEVAAFHVHPYLEAYSSLWPYSSPYTVNSFQRTAVSRHPALCSPDFPLSIAGQRLSGWL